jgi:hypothetical protein
LNGGSETTARSTSTSDGRLVAKVEVPGLLVLTGKMGRRLQRILERLVEEGEI